MSQQPTLIRSSPEYAGIWHKWRNEPNMLRFNPVMKSSVEELKERLSKAGSDLNDLKKFESYRWFVKTEEGIIGTVSLSSINHMMKFAEIGYGVGEEFQGRGLGTKSVKLLLDKIFIQTDLRKLIAYVSTNNAASCALLEKLGFKREGLLKEHYIVNGNPTDEGLYAILRSEWLN